MSFFQLTEQVTELAARYIGTEMTSTTCKELGLDPRACYNNIWKNDECVAIHRRNRGSFDYYAGAEYVDRMYVYELGDYVFYSANCSRVAGWLGQDSQDQA